MSKLLVKNSNTWQYPKSIYVKQNDRWKPAREVWVKEGEDWKIAWPNNTGTITYTEATFGTFQVPDGIYNIEVYWPTSSTYISSATLAVTPGSQISYQIGAYGEASNFGGIATSKFDKEVMKFRGNVDDTFKQVISIATTAKTSYSNYNNDTGLGAGELSVNAAAAGINYSEPVETKHGDLSANISLTPVVISDILPGDIKLVFSDVAFAGGGTSVISQQPSAANGYTTIIFTTDPSAAPQESIHYYTLNLQQQTPVSIKWGDWENTATITNPTAPVIYLVNPNTGTTAGGKFIEITGSRFVSNSATSVTIGGAPITTFTVVNDTKITGYTPAGSTGSANVIVTGFSGTNEGNSLFAYQNPVAPVLTYNIVFSSVSAIGSLTFNVSGGPPNGTIYLTDTTYGVVSDTFVLNSNGVGTFTTLVYAEPGDHTMVATYSDGYTQTYTLTVT